MSKQPIFSVEGRLNTKSRRQAELKKISKSLTPEVETYRKNSTKEELCHEYITSLSNQFIKVHPKRKTPFMVSQNEYGVKKFLPTALRSTQVPFAELYDLHECASFFAGYIQYEPLDPPYEPPSTVFSPTQTLSSFVGDCFDISTVLVSFLLGAGYDAYVVNGYAPKYVALKDQSMSQCPMISGPKETPKVLLMIPEEIIASSTTTITSENNSNNSNNINNNNNSNNPSNPETDYQIIDNSVKGSVYLKDRKEAEIAAGRDTFQLWIPEDSIGNINVNSNINGPVKLDSVDTETMEDNKLVHSWVMVLPGRRDVKETLYIEPTTGRIYNQSNSPYYGIESVWNQVNYWINLRIDRLANDLTFDLQNGHYWECTFIEASNTRTKEGISQDNNNNSNSNSSSSISSTNHNSSSLSHSTSRSKHPDPNVYQVGTATITISRAFDCPPSYVNPIDFNRNHYLARYPPLGKRCIKFYCSKADYFARGVHSQSMVMRITHYLDQSCTTVKEIHEWYESRKDKLYKRSRYFLNDAHTIEYFHPGSIGEIKQWTEYTGKKIITDYYVEGNLERLVRREEIIGDRVTEYYDGRTDRLAQRTVDYTIHKQFVGTRTFPLPGNTLSNELYILSMQQVYDKNIESNQNSFPSSSSSLSSKRNITGSSSSSNTSNNNQLSDDNNNSNNNHENVYTRNYYIPEGKLVIKYHCVSGSISNDIKTYFHTRVGLSNTAAYINEISVLQETGLDENPDKLQEASLLERECYASIRTSIQAFIDILNKRANHENSIIIDRSVYERAVDKAYEQGNNGGGNNSNNINTTNSNSGSGNNTNNNNSNNGSNSNSNSGMKSADYLTPYMRHLTNKDISQITREEALEIRQNCLDAMKSRLIERANIIQSRLNDENTKLGRKQEQFQRSQREGDFSTEEYEKYCTEAMFRIQILEKRLVDHEESSLKKFAELDARLASDPRLKVLRV